MGIKSGHDAEHQGTIFGGTCHWATLVKRGGKGDHAVAGDAAIGRFEPRDAAQCSGLADRAAQCRYLWPRGRGAPPTQAS